MFCRATIVVANLQNEGFAFNTPDFKQNIHNIGDIMQDSAIFYAKFAKKPDFNLNGNFLLCTIRRAENTDNLKRLKDIFDGLNLISNEIKIVLPIHPRTKNILSNSDINISKNIMIVESVGYLKMVWLIKHLKMIVADCKKRHIFC